ncbi:hypothetical protein OF83DRAFT_1088253 [Amylostereum chailletii]|nr:hypothetical protein OF83DRAFT_1088253 [Amylostereum chailletii]
MPRQSLFPFDVFHIIDSLIDRDTLLSFLKTCRRYQEYGALCLLRHKVVLHREGCGGRDDIASFACFMLADGPGRIPLLRRLELVDTDDRHSPEDFGPLTQVVSRASNVEELVLSNALREGGVFGSPALSAAIGALPNVKRLEVSIGEPTATDFLKSMRSLLLNVRINSWCVPTERPLHLALDPLSALAPYSSTLQKLELRHAKLLDPQVVFPHVHTLHLRDCFSTDVEPIMLSFPNLRHFSASNDLCIEHMLSRWTEGSDVIYMEPDEQREAVGGWSSLESLAGKMLSLHFYGVSCPVGRLVIGNIECDDYGRRQIKGILSRACPKDALILHFSPEDWDEESEQLHRILPEGTNVPRLALHFDLSSYFVSPTILMTQIYALSETISVSSFHLGMRFSNDIDPWLTDEVDEVDREKVALQLANRIPTLAQVSLDISSGYDGPEPTTVRWDVVRKGGRCELVVKKGGASGEGLEWEKGSISDM